MKPSMIKKALVASSGLLLAVGALVGMGAPAQAADATISCEDSLVTKDLKNGSSWRMCARIHPIKGLVLEEIQFKPASGKHEYSGYKQVLDEISMGQLNVPYDTGHVQYNDITSYGFGKQYLLELGKEQCKGDLLDVDQSFTYQQRLIERTVKGICTDEVDTGLMTHAQETQLGGGVLYADQGTGLEVSSIAKISWYEYQQRYVFDDHGQIEVGLGATGDIAPGAPGSNFFTTNPKVGWPLGGDKTADGSETYASSHWHNAIWKVDFGIDKGERQLVEQWDFSSPGNGRGAPIVENNGTVKDRAFSAVPGEDHDELTWWRVLNPNSKNRDGHARSYEIVNQNYANKLIPFTQPIITFTNARACQEYASANLHAGCPQQSILDYVENDTHELNDPVAWVNVGFHHTDKDEDQSPMPIHWQKFQIVPRDFFAQKPTITDARICVNGATGGAVNSTTRPCIATNTEAPTISPSGEVTVGTELKATSGTWNEVRTTWNYSWMWFRNGEPIINVGPEGEDVPAVGDTYTVTDADKGTKITAKVTAAQSGYPSGTAETEAVSVPGDPIEASTVTGRVSPASVRVGASAKATAVVKAGSAQPSGTVDAFVGSTMVGSGNLNGQGVASLTIKPFTTAGVKQIVLKYAGSETTLASASSPLKLTVTKAPSKVAASFKAKKVKVKKKPVVRVTVSGTGATATGKVQVVRGSKVLGTATLKNGKANVTLKAFKKAGTYKVKVKYLGSAQVNASTSKTIAVKVVK